MTDLLPVVRDVLKPIGAQIELSYNNISAEFPLIVLTETSNTSDVIADGAEWISNIEIQVDIYEFSFKKAVNLAKVVSEKLISTGFRRTFAQSSKEDDVERYTLLFSCLLDGDNRIYRGANLL